MKKIKVASFVLCVVTVAALAGCGSKRDPGRVYMPDMAYSRTYEAYSLLDSTRFTTDASKRGGKIFFNSMPVPGTLQRGELFPYVVPTDTTGSYARSTSLKNPLDSMSAADLAEAGRLFNINCAICHGEKGAANGPLATGGKIGGVANLASGEKTMLSDGTMFHVMTYGKGIMGSYASQLTRKQRWQIIKYVRTLQNPAAAAGTDSTAAKKGADSAAVAKKS
jgi:mono/diheme cytochrome c family protein/predicted small lipoprotein YifL